MSNRAPITTRRRGASVVTPLLLALGLAGPAHAAGGGLNLTPDPISLAINLVMLGLLVYPVNRLLLQPIVRILQEREARTAGAAERASSLSGDVGALATEIESRLAAARREAQAYRAQIMAKAAEEDRRVLTLARDESSRTLDPVRASVAQELERARTGLREDVVTLAREAASRVLGRGL